MASFQDLVKEISIERMGLMLWAGRPRLGEEPHAILSSVLRQLDEATARGVRVVLLTVDSLGGELGAGIALFAALRRFSEAGGAVVGFVSGAAISSAALYVLAADHLVVHPQAELRYHGVRSHGAQQLSEEGLETANVEAAAIVCSRSAVRAETVWEWLSRPVTDLDPGGELLGADRAVAAGMADSVGGRGDARALARSFALAPSRPAFARGSKTDPACPFAPWLSHVMAAGDAVAAKARAGFYDVPPDGMR